MIHQSVLDDFARITASLEGVKNFCYLCSRGKCTVSDGCALFTVEQALPLDWRHGDGSKATREEIAAEWHLINSHQELAGKVAERALKVPRTDGAAPLRLTPVAMAALSKQRLDKATEDLGRRYPAWGAWPPQACLALLLTVWGTGTASPYPLRDAALKALDFETAAEESAIADNPPRSAVIKALFLEAAAQAPLTRSTWPEMTDDERARTLDLVASTLAASVNAAIDSGRRERNEDVS